MRDIDLQIRMQLLRLHPELTLSQADELIRGVAVDCLNVHNDNVAYNMAEPWDFYTFCYIADVALVAICSEASIELLSFAADPSLIHDTGHLTLSEVVEFLAFAANRFALPDTWLVLPTAEARTWLETHSESI